MPSDSRLQFGFNEIATPILAVVLWHTTIWLLGLSDTMPPGIKAKVGSTLVLLGCFVLARPLVAMTALLFRPKAPLSVAPPTSDAAKSSTATPRSAIFRRSGSRPHLS